ncbi:hypothetical protein EI94DRAFT_1804278 [Lactarius quietus]|nr:hypothetical protein EI94DRAFT_1804278 [Lactarius quietus]
MGTAGSRGHQPSSKDATDAADTHTDPAEAMEHDDELAPSQDTARANDEDTADLTPEEGCVDPDDIIDADILEALMEDIDSSAAINPDVTFLPNVVPTWNSLVTLIQEQANSS